MDNPRRIRAKVCADISTNLGSSIIQPQVAHIG